MIIGIRGERFLLLPQTMVLFGCHRTDVGGDR